MCAHQNREINMSRKVHVIRYLYGLYKGVTPPRRSSLRSRRLEVVGARKKARVRGRHARGEGACLSRAVLSWPGFSPLLSFLGKNAYKLKQNKPSYKINFRLPPLPECLPYERNGGAQRKLRINETNRPYLCYPPSLQAL